MADDLKVKDPIQGGFFIWAACRERLLTLDFLQPMCLQDGESLNHLFFHCPFTQDVGEGMLREVGVN